MKISVPKETAERERRVALVPEVVERLRRDEVEVEVEAGAGREAFHPDAEYEDAGATVSEGGGFSGEVVVKVAAPSADEIGRLNEGQVLIGFLQPLTNADTVRALADARVTSFAM